MNTKQEKILNILAVVFAFLYIPLLFHIDSFDEIYKLQSSIFSKTEIILLLILKVVTIASVIVMFLQPIFKKRMPYLTNLLAVFVLPVFALNLILLKQNMLMMFGEEIYTNIRSYIFIAFCLIGVVVPVLNIIYKNIKFNSREIIRNTVISLVCILALSFPISGLTILFGTETGLHFKDFNDEHMNILYFSFLFPIALYFIFKNKDYQFKRFMVTLLAVAGFIHYYYKYSLIIPVGSLPFHLCNTAMFLIPLALLLKSEKVFYFTYFVNVIGALFAMLLPNTTGDIFSLNVIHFWINHAVAFFLPVLVVALDVFPRPKFKQFKYALIAFSTYFLFAMGSNMILSNYGTVDFFFLNSDFFVDKFVFFYRVRDNAFMTFNWNDWVINMWPLYWLGIYVGYIILMCGMWVFYISLYKLMDHYAEFINKFRKDRKDYIAFMKEQKSMSEEAVKNKKTSKTVKVINFYKQYHKGGEFSAENINFTLKPGKVVGFLGHNGAGKSTTIKSIIGLQSITEGKIELFGYDIEKEPLMAKKQLGYVPDNHALYENLTGREYINYVADLYSVPKETRDEDLPKYLKQFELEDAIDRQIKTYSHGMKQKVAVIATILHNPRLWILDEPLSGLDPSSVYQIKKCMIDHAKKGNIVFFSSHIIDVAERVCDEVIIISKGKIKKHIDVAEATKDGLTLEQIYIREIDQKEVSDKDKKLTKKKK